jgi:hypothetical protein
VCENDIPIYRAAKEIELGYSTAKSIFSKAGGRKNVEKKVREGLRAGLRGHNERISV